MRLTLVLSALLASAATAVGAGTPSYASGVVRDQSGKPVAGAVVMLYLHKSNWGLDNEVVETVKTNAAGAYEFTKPLKFLVPSGTDYNDHYVIVASHPDRAFGWVKVTASEQEDEYDIVLAAPPMKQSFVVTSADGAPLAGATVWVSSAGAAQDAQPYYRRYMRLPTNIKLAEAVTDAGGRATVTNLPDTSVNFRVSLKGYADQWSFPGRPGREEAKVKLTPAAVVRGMVSNELGEPVKNATVAFDADWMHSATLVRTNGAGKFECDALTPRGGSWAEQGGNGTYNVFIRHPDYCSAVHKLTVDPAQVVEDFNISAERGSVLRAIVVNAGNAAPVGGVRLQAFMRDHRLDGYTNDKGIIEWRTLPGEYRVMFISPPAGMYVMGERPNMHVTVGEDLTEITVDPPIEFKPLVTVRGKVVGPDGAAAAGVKVNAMCAENVQTPGQVGFGQETVADAGGKFTIKGFPSETRLCVYAETTDRKLAGTGEFNVAKDAGDLNEPIKLRQTQSIDFDLRSVGGQDVSDAKMRIAPIVGGKQLWRGARTVRTDAEGRLKMDGVLPGLTYNVQDQRYQESGGRLQGGAANLWLRKDLQLLPAE